MLIYIATIIVTNRTNRAVTMEITGSFANAEREAEILTVTIWNIGYSSLGSESDFIADGGKHILPPSRRIVEKNLNGIVRILTGLSSEILMLQEISGPSFLTRGHDVLGAVNNALAERNNAFSADFSILGTPYPFNPRHGLYTSLSIGPTTREIVPLPLEPDFMAGLTKRLYHLHVIRFPANNGNWTIINLHLSAFDNGANVRKKQLDAVFDFAASEYAQGNYVIIGGDWNLEFARPPRPSTTADRDLFWIHPFPHSELPESWKIAMDDMVPTVRTNERPYKRNENFTTIIDAFVVSPNISIESVNTLDTNFEFTDHQPVTVRVRANTDG